VRFANDCLALFINGQEKTLPLKELSPKLFQATPDERNNFELSPSGYGIHWPLIDEDISIDGLLGIAHKPDMKRGTA